MERSISHKACDVYEAVRLTFADRASPYLAQFVIRSHALDFKENHPAAVMVLLRDMYVDDILHSEETVQDAVLVRPWVTLVSVPKSGVVTEQRY